MFNIIHMLHFPGLDIKHSEPAYDKPMLLSNGHVILPMNPIDSQQATETREAERNGQHFVNDHTVESMQTRPANPKSPTNIRTEVFTV